MLRSGWVGVGDVAGWEKTGRQREARSGRMRAVSMGFEGPVPGGLPLSSSVWR